VLAALLLCLIAGGACAAGRICTSRDVLLFGNQATGTAVTQSSTVTNCGDAPFSFTDVSVHPATAAAYHVTSSCATGQALAPSQGCSVDVTFAPLAPGQVSGGLWLHNTTSTPDQIVTFYGRGVDQRAGTTALEFIPSTLDFGPQVVGTTSPARTLTLHNLGPSQLTISAMVLNGPTPYDFRFPGNCMLGVPIPADGTCELYFNFTPPAVGTRLAKLNIDAPELANLATMTVSGLGVQTVAPPPGPAPVDIIEFYNAPLNHYFLTAVAEEVAAIDRGVVGPDWHRTGYTWKSYPAYTSGGAAIDVCRFFGTPNLGPSAHFYTADPAECALVKTNPRWTYEGIAFRALLPALGACPAGTQPVVRFFWAGTHVSQSRHRYVRDPAEIGRMRDAGWIEEGPVFCSP
jgi:hypothetical protein